MRAKRTLTPYLTGEYLTIKAMTQIYCQAHHKEGNSAPCKDCQSFLEFAKKKLALCPYGDDKPACSKCPVHCYGKNKREQAKVIMRYAGPRMLWRHPVMALKHLIQKRRAVPK